MPNACFRCKIPIDSGGTFCQDCDREVSLGDLQYTRESRAWIGVAALPVWLLLSFVVLPAVAWVAPGDAITAVSIASSFIILPLVFAFMWALVADAEHIRTRDDTDWEPSKWGYWSLAFASFFFVLIPVPFVAGYHLYKRYRTIGLPVGRN